MKRSELDKKLKSDINETVFVDGLQYQVRTRVKTLPEIVEYIDTLDRLDNIFHPINEITNLFLKIKTLLDLDILNSNVLNNE